jgi:hypothetical protein
MTSLGFLEALGFPEASTRKIVFGSKIVLVPASAKTAG